MDRDGRRPAESFLDEGVVTVATTNSHGAGDVLDRQILWTRCGVYYGDDDDDDNDDGDDDNDDDDNDDGDI